VADVRPLYHDANLVLVPTLESAGTNVKVLEAMAMQRAVISTSSGVAGLGLEHGKHVWVADQAADLAQGIERLLEDPALRASIATAGRLCAEQRFDWRAIGLRERVMLREMLGDTVEIRAAAPSDLDAIMAIQNAAPDASHWEPADYLRNDCLVAIDVAIDAGKSGQVLGFLLSRQTAPGEREILNVAVGGAARRCGIGRRLLEAELARGRNTWFLEVRESNAAARALYQSSGFQQIGLRGSYYHDPPESGIVMKFIS
jgi:ribosomal protein S18 acetylase RimI-like enzyme